MAKSGQDMESLCRGLVQDIRGKKFSPVYLLMGEEPYYPDMVCEAIIENALEEWEKDFNEIICYGADVDADTVVTAARRFPMMADRQLVVVKEAQMMKTLEDLAVYCANPLDSTVLVILMHGASADKRKALYKSVQKNGTVVDSPLIKDYQMPGWISSYYSGQGLSISPDGAALLAESVGTDMGRVVVETAKMLKNLPEGTVNITSEDVEKNIGISRQFSIFELTKELSSHNAAKALRIAAYVGAAPKFAMPMAVSALYTHFNRILKYGALMAAGNATPEMKAKALAGVNPYFYREYDQAVRLYPPRKCMAVMSLLCEYDLKGKGGDSQETTAAQLLSELVAKILNI